MSTVPGITLGPLGWIIPQESAVLAGVRADLNTAFGGNLNPALETPQGQVATTETAIIGSKNDEVLALFNSFDPQYAAGRAQDALARIYFLERDPARPTAVTATCTGAPTTVIPIGALARATDGNLYICTSATTIPIGGTVSVPFECQTTGPIVCPAGSLDRIYQAIPGWDTITNAADGTVGNSVESRSAFETRRQQSVALNARGILSAVQGAVLDVENVLDAYTTENPTGSPLVIGGYTLAKNSLYVAVTGGTNQAVGDAIWSKKSPGCNYNGATTVTVTDDQSGYEIPYPTYAVSFVRPSDLPVLFEVGIRNSTSVPSNYETLIEDALIAAFAGEDGGPRARIGSQIYALRFFSAIAALGAWAQVVSIKIGTTLADQDYISVDIDNQPSLSAGDIVVNLI